MKLMGVKIEVLFRSENQVVTAGCDNLIRIVNKDKEYASALFVQMIDCIELFSKKLIITCSEPNEDGTKNRYKHSIIEGDTKELIYLYDKLRNLIEKNVLPIVEEEDFI